jgi:hypothetical protein
MSWYLAEQRRTPADDVLTGELADVASVCAEELAWVVPAVEPALAWPKVGVQPRSGEISVAQWRKGQVSAIQRHFRK